jgi:flagellar M-ring protein FliF
VVRSENILTERKAKKGESGVPGALSNQPFFLQKSEREEGHNTHQPNHLRDQSTRNFEVDKSVKHVKHQAGRLSRLSVAVVINDKKPSLSDVDLAKIESLVKHAVGYQAARGDTVSVTHTAFVSKSPQDITSTEPFYEHPNFMAFLRLLVVGILGILAILLVFKPLFARLLHLSDQEQERLKKMPETIDPALKNETMLRSTDPKIIAGLVQKEHPQIQAIILSYLTPEQSAAVMAQIPEDLRVDLMVRLATLSSITPEALKVLNKMLQEQLSGHSDVVL